MRLRKRHKKWAGYKILLWVVGFIGTGPSLIDKMIAEKRGVPKPTHRELRQLKHLIPASKELHRDSFRNACMDVLGEDPDDWR